MPVMIFFLFHIYLEAMLIAIHLQVIFFFFLLDMLVLLPANQLFNAELPFKGCFCPAAPRMD